jgi:pyoverdine/dityrosine biosynthesis protein Dit1
MSQKELLGYVLDHRHDRDAFYAYVDKLHEEGNWIEMPAVESVEDLEKYPEFTSRFHKSSDS